MFANTFFEQKRCLETFYLGLIGHKMIVQKYRAVI